MQSAIRTWQRALEAAYDYSAQLKVARAQVRQQQDALKRAQAEWVPTVEATAGYGYTYTHKDLGRTQAGARDVNSHQNSLSLGAKLEENLFESGGTVFRIKSARQNLRAALFELKKRESEVLLATFEAFLNVLIAQESIRFNVGNVQRAKRLQSNAEIRFKAGLVSRDQVLLAQANLADAEQKLTASEASLIAANATLQQMTGQTIRMQLAWPEDRMFHKLVRPLQPADRLLKRALANNFSVLAAQKRMQATRNSAYATRSSRMLPSLKLTAGVLQGFDTVNQKAPGTSVKRTNSPFEAKVALGLTVPLPLGREQAEVRQAEQQYSQSRWTFQEAQLELRSNLHIAVAKQHAAQKSVQHHALEKRAHKLALDAMQESYAQGERTMVDISDVQEREARSYHQWLDARKNHVLESLKLHVLTGHFTARELDLDVAYYDPSTYDKWFGLAPEEKGVTPLEASAG